MSKWTNEEVEALKQNYNKSWEELQIILPKRTIKSLKSKIYKIGLRRDVSIPYTNEEDEIIKLNYGKSFNTYSHLLNNRTIQSVRNRLNLLGLYNLDMSKSDLIYELYVIKEMSIRSISEQLKINKHTVSAILTKLNVKQRILQEEIDVTIGRYEIVDLYKYGFTLTDIKNMYSCSADIIKRILSMEDVVIYSKRKRKPKLNKKPKHKIDSKIIKNPVKTTQKSLKSHRKNRLYKDWRVSVLERDNYTCQCCYSKEHPLNVHHINNYLQHPELRLELTNGIALCRDCHDMTVKGSFHNLYGTYDNNIHQIQEYFDYIRGLMGLPLTDILKDITHKDYIFDN